jgi:alkanesulfonate monooxygenase SsuD/methylene tetrahydromethanopterin reductase-like flavin-dependent oxidoreductase (luciferase family)
VFPSLADARARRRLLDDAARSAGREPLVFSMMTGCVVGRDEDEARNRLERWRAITKQPHGQPPLYGTLDEVVERLHAYEAAGVERVMLQHLAHEDLEMVGLLGEVASAL